VSIFGKMLGFIEYQRNLKNNVKFIEENSDNSELPNKIKNINIDQFIKKNPSLRDIFGKKSVNLKIGDKIKALVLKYYIKLNNEVIFVCDFDNENFEIIN